MNAERKKPSSQLGIAPTATPRPAHSTRVSAPSAWTGLSWKSLLGLEDAPPRSRPEAGTTTLRPSETRRTSKERLDPTAGFYSAKPDAEDATLSISPPVVIPKTPQLPVDLVGLSRQGSPSERGPHSSLGSMAAPPALGTPLLAVGMDGSPPLSVTFAHFPPPMESAGSDDSAGAKRSDPADSSRPLQFPSHIREQAEDWLKSGSLSLPNCSSPRHARAMQRALLLALLDRPGYHRLPLGLQQRVGWLLSPGWERQTTGSVASEASDLLTVLCVAAGAASMQAMMSALRQLIPDPLPLVRPPSSFPPARR